MQHLLTDIVSNLELIRKPHQVVEVRILKTRNGTVSGYYDYDNYSKIIQDIKPYIGKNDIYFTLNPVKEALIARSKNRLTTYAKNTTSDSDIEKISYILIDLDPVRPSGISSTEEEKKKAYEKAKEIYEFLLTLGWPKPIVADSGNGYHLLYSVDLTNSKENRELLKQLLHSLDQLFSDESTLVDKTTFNPSRIVKLYGTKSCKGDSIKERPHRVSGILFHPKEVVEVSESNIAKINELFVHDKSSINECTSSNNNHETQSFNVEAFIEQYGLGEYRKSEWNNGTRYVLKQCPFNEEHQDSSAYLIQFDNGAICAGCHHDSCSDNNWGTLKDKVGVPKREEMNLNKGGEEEKSQKESVSDILLRLTQHLTFFSDELNEAHVNIPLNGAVKLVKVNSEYFKKWLTKVYYDETRKAVTAEGLNQTINVLEAKGLFSNNTNRKMFQRVGKLNQNFYYDIYDGKGRIVEISNSSCKIVNDSYGIFNQKGAMSAQVEPVFDVTSKQLIKMIKECFNFNSSNDAILYLIYIITCYVPEISHPVLILHGEKGAAKSTTMKFTRLLVDPSRVPLISMPTKIDDLAGSLAKTHMICFDNLATLKSEVSDMLCMASTGGGYSKRKLYTDDEEVIYNFKRCICLNGIAVVATQPDLLDRGLLIELSRISAGAYQTETTINERFDSLRPEIVGGCLNALAKAMAIYSYTDVSELGRMADFMKWGFVIAEVLGIGGKNFIAIYKENQNKSILEAIDSHPVAMAVKSFMTDQLEWSGSVQSLFKKLNGVALSDSLDTTDRLWPKAPKSLSTRLKEVKSNLEAIGITYSIRNTGKYKEITLQSKK